VSAASAG
jgi:hypothetical protein